MSWDKKHLLDMDSLSRKDIEDLFDLASKLLPYSGIDKTIKCNEHREPLDICKGKFMKLWFGEPSTRTYGSFETAMIRLGGIPLKFEEDASSLKKKESIKHTNRILSGQADILVDRHRDPNHIYKLAENSLVPSINGGNGSYQHPTQTLQDLYTIYISSGRVDGIRIAIIGDLKYGRTTHSLTRGLGKFDNIEIDGVSPPGLEMPEEHIANVKYHSHIIHMKKDLKSTLEDIKPDYIYATRIQTERIPFWKRVLQRNKYRYQIDKETLDNLPNVKLMHPLPIATDTKYGPEIATELDDDPRTIYFQQADYGIPMRMAIITTLLGYEKEVLKLN